MPHPKAPADTYECDSGNYVHPSASTTASDAQGTPVEGEGQTLVEVAMHLAVDVFLAMTTDRHL